MDKGEKWICANDKCQQAAQRPRLISNMNQQQEALKECRQRMEQELDMEIMIKRKEMELRREMEMKRSVLEKQIREKEEEQEQHLQAEILRERERQLIRMKARYQSFLKKMNSLDDQIASVKFKSKDDVVNDENYSNKDSKCEDSDSCKSSDDSLTVKTRRKIFGHRYKFGKSNSHGLGQSCFGPTKSQLAARSGICRKLPNFSGKPEEWPLFYGAYQVSNNACGYTDVENLVRLQDCLKGPALEMVRGILLLPKTVPKVIEKLRQLYGRPEQLLQSHLFKIRNLQPPKVDNLATFIPFGTAVEQLCEHLEAAEMREHLINPLLIQELVDKLPDNDKRGWVRFKKLYKKVNLRTFTKFVSDIVSEACEAKVNLDYTAVNEFSLDGSSKANDSFENRNVMYNSEKEREDSQSDEEWRDCEQCQVCRSNDHQLRDCLDFQKMSYGERIKGVDKWRICHLGLNDHGETLCKFEILCNVEDCQQPHNPLLHPKRDSVGISAHIQTNSSVLFRMIPVKLHCGAKTINTLAFLDEGASVTLIENKLADRLGGHGVQEELTIEWTAGIDRVEEGSKRMNLCISGDKTDEKLSLKSVHTVEKLKLPVQSLNAPKISQAYQHMRGLPITSYSSRPEILIGVDNIHLFAPIDSRIRGPAEPIAVKCKLGWTVYGPWQGLPVNKTAYLGVHQQVVNRKLHKVPDKPLKTKERNDETTAQCYKCKFQKKDETFHTKDVAVSNDSYGKSSETCITGCYGLGHVMTPHNSTTGVMGYQRSNDKSRKLQPSSGSKTKPDKNK